MRGAELRLEISLRLRRRRRVHCWERGCAERGSSCHVRSLGPWVPRIENCSPCKRGQGYYRANFGALLLRSDQKARWEIRITDASEAAVVRAHLYFLVLLYTLIAGIGAIREDSGVHEAGSTERCSAEA